MPMSERWLKSWLHQQFRPQRILRNPFSLFSVSPDLFTFWISRGLPPPPPKDPQPPPPNSPSCNSSSCYDDVCKINNTLFFASRRLIHVDTFIDIDSLQIHSDIVEMNSTHFKSSEEKNLWVEEFFSLLSNHFKLVRCLNEMVKAGISIFCLGLIWELPSIISRIKRTIKITTLLGFRELFIFCKKNWANWNTANTVCALITWASTSRVDYDFWFGS